MISAIILSAGASGRMGTPKALLRIGDQNFLQHIINKLEHQHIHKIYVIIGADADDIKPTLSGLQVNIIINEQWRNGQLSSLIAGLHELDERENDAALIWPVDHPLVTETTIKKMINTFINDKDKIIIPKYNGRRGHPVIFPKSLFSQLRTAPFEKGARVVVHQNEDRVLEVETDDESVAINIDTPEDYERFVLKNK